MTCATESSESSWATRSTGAPSGWHGGTAANAEYGLPTFPFFVLPYKRYDSQSLQDLATSYVENDQQSYRRTVMPNDRIIGYDLANTSPPVGGDPEPPTTATSEDTATGHDDRCTHHSLVWRMLGWLGGLTVALSQAHQMLGSLDPQATHHRFVGAVARQKFRSRQRRHTLERARQLLKLIPDWEARFAEKFFPRFATRASFQ